MGRESRSFDPASTVLVTVGAVAFPPAIARPTALPGEFRGFHAILSADLPALPAGSPSQQPAPPRETSGRRHGSHSDGHRFHSPHRSAPYGDRPPIRRMD